MIFRHHCHWPGCSVAVPPRMFMCRPHWFRLPVLMRHQIWKTYRPGQEIDNDPSPEYLAAAREALDWGAARNAERTYNTHLS